MYVHATNPLLFLVEIFVVAFPTRLFHFVYPITLSFIYAVTFAAGLYFAYANSSNYPKTNLAEITVLAIGVLVFIPIMHFIAFLCYCFRNFIFNQNETEESKSMSPEAVRSIVSSNVFSQEYITADNLDATSSTSDL